MVGTRWEKPALLTWEKYRELQYPSDEVIVVVVSCEKESSSCEESCDDMISSYTFPECDEHHDIYREDKNPLPPTEDTDSKVKVELVCESKCRRKDSDCPDDFHVGEVSYILHLGTSSLMENIQQKWEDSEPKYSQNSKWEYERVECHAHRKKEKRDTREYLK